MADLTWNTCRQKFEKLLCPPGSGVFTVHTAQERRLGVQEKIYGVKGDDATYARLWKESLAHLPMGPQAALLGIPSDCGGGILRGANWGPLFLRDALLSSREELTAFDLGDVRVVPHLLHDKYLNEATIRGCRQALYCNGEENLPVSPLSIAQEVAQDFYRLFPHKGLFSMGGDHSTSYPVVRAWLESRKRLGKKAALVHFDAHTDLLTERLGIDLCFGSWAAQVMPFLESPELMAQIGIRASGKEKEHWEKTFGLKQYWAQECEGAGAQEVARDIVRRFQKAGVQEVYVSFDIDVLDITYAGATGTPEPGGLSPHEPMLIMQEIFEHFPISGADLMEIAPMTRPTEVRGVGPETTLMVGQAIATFLIQAIATRK